MVVSIQFFLLLLLLYFSGRGIFVFLGKVKLIEEDITNLHIFTVPINYFYILTFLIFLGNITFLLHFFIEIPETLVLVIGTIFILFNFFNIRKFKLNIFVAAATVITVFLFSLSTYTTGLSYDAGLYHLNNHLWMKTEKIVIGLSNLHMRYGYSSIYDYIAVNFNYFDNFLALHFVNLSFLFCFALIIFYFVSESKSIFFKSSSLGILIFGILDNFGFNGGKNGFLEIEGITKYDSVFAVSFVLGNIFLINVMRNKKLDKFELFYFLVLCIFLIQLRPTGILFTTFSLLIFTILFGIELIDMIFTKKTILLFLFLIIWFIKNILVSGCIIFPVEATCIQDLIWYKSGYANEETLNISNSLRSYVLFTNPFDWFDYWTNKNSYNLSTIKNLSFSIMLIYIFKKIFFSSKKVNFLYFSFYLYAILLILFWTYTAPDFRFGIGIFITLIISIFVNVDSMKLKFNKLIYFVIFSLCIFTIPRFENYSTFLKNSFEFIEIEAPTNPKYMDKVNSYGVTTEDDSEQCWINIDCSPNYSPNVRKEIINSYTVFIQKNN